MKKILAALIITIVQSFGATTPSQEEPITSVSSEIQTTVENENNSKLYREKLAIIKDRKEQKKILRTIFCVSTIVNGILAYMLRGPDNKDAITNFWAGCTLRFTLCSAIACVLSDIGLFVDDLAEKKLNEKFDGTKEKSLKNELATAILTTPL